MANPVDVATSFLRALAGNDPDAIAELVAEGFRNEHQSALGSDCVGRDEYRRRLPHFLDAFQDRSYEVDDLVAQRRDAVTDVVVRYRFHAQYGDATVEIPGVMWLTVRGQLLTRRVDTFDSLTFLEQTGQTREPE
ncbi:MAG: nuclear transport factor 2 family protein [Ilumatobacter sp.]|uniref:nuclear transport factor 2 family protein n=1 Tax=Ilumatobacter sp. TaxID=1967498 RepID=UPI003C72BCCA